MLASGPVCGASRIDERRARYLFVGILLLAASLLLIGVGQDYRLKHEDNNAPYAAFARSHLNLGLGTTHAHDVLSGGGGGELFFYGHHPPGPGLVVAAFFKVTGWRGPAAVRSLAIFFHLVSLCLFYFLARRVLSLRDALSAALLFAVLPEGSFFGRMVNHEPLALSAMLLVVGCYWSYLEGAEDYRGRGQLRLVLLALAAAWSALLGWVSFFLLGAVTAHAFVRSRPSADDSANGPALVVSSVRTRARTVFWYLAILTPVLFAADLLHLKWAAGSEGDLGSTFLSRLGFGAEYTLWKWAGQLLEVQLRYFTVTGTVASFWLGWRLLSALTGRTSLSAAEEVAALFFSAGVAYLLVFNYGSMKHHYWQFPLLPAVAIAMVLLLGRGRELYLRVLASRGSTARVAARALALLVLLDLVAAPTITLYRSHTRIDQRVIDTVEALRRSTLALKANPYL